MGWKNKSLGILRQLIGSGFDERHVGLARAEAAEFALRAAMAERRRLLRKIAGARSGDARVRVAAQRYARQRARALKKMFITRRSWEIPKSLLYRKLQPSMVLDTLDPARPSRWKPLAARRYIRQFPRLTLSNLNFIDDPIGTLDQLTEISEAESTCLNAYLDFNDDHCADVGAYLVIAEIWPQLSKVFRGGRMSLPVQKVLSAIQLDKELSIGLTAVRDHKDVWAFPVKHRRPRGTTISETANLQPQEREKVADQLCDLVNEWLDVASNVDESPDNISFELNPEGRSLIARMTGELLDNAERHSLAGSNDGDWSTTAFMAARTNELGEREMRCYLAFLSTGQSIAESMAKAPARLLQQADVYLDRCSRSAASRETLLTVFALQDAVTSDVNAAMNFRGGTGLQDVLELVGDLGAAHNEGADVRVTIVSGTSCIRLRHPYLMGRRDARGRRVQWCNRSNDPHSPPDSDIAFDLPRKLAGTLVSVGFTLDPRLFVTDMEEDDVSGDQP